MRARFKCADIVVVHSHSRKFRVLGKDVHLPEALDHKGRVVTKGIDFGTFPTLPQLIAGEVGSRTSPEQVTCFLNNTGLGYQFAAAGAVVHSKAKRAGLGHELPTDWFTEDVHP